MLALGRYVLGDLVRLDDLVRNLNEAGLELPQLLHEKKFEPLEILFLFGDAEGQLFKLLVQKLLLELYLTGQLVAERHKLRINLQVDEDSAHFFVELSLQFVLFRLEIGPHLQY